MKKALITGITGQDGSYLAELLLDKGYEVHGIVRRASTFNTERIDHLRRGRHPAGEHLRLHHGDMLDSSNLWRLLKEIMPDEIYHLGAQSHVRVSFEVPEYTGDVTGLSTTRLLEAMRAACPEAHFYQASTSEMFGKAEEVPQRETTPFHPRSPYGCAKVYAYWIVKNYREGYGLFASNGILFNHESERRGETFVTRKITQALARIRCGSEETLRLGNLDAKRDWGHARDYVEGMWRILRHGEADDFVLATGETHSVREFVMEAAGQLGFDIIWEGEGLHEQGIDRKTGRAIVKIDPYFFRPAEVDLLIGDARKAKELLGWEPKIRFRELVRLMVEHDMSVCKAYAGQGR